MVAESCRTGDCGGGGQVLTGEVVRGKIGDWDKVGEVDEEDAEGCEGHGSCAIEEDAVVREGGSPEGSGIFAW